jgi:hypothetical protein
MGGGRIFPKNLRASLFNDDLSNKLNLGRIHLAGQYLDSTSRSIFKFKRTSGVEERKGAGDGHIPKSSSACLNSIQIHFSSCTIFLKGLGDA